MTAMPWHDHAQILKAAVAAGDADRFERLRAAAFAEPNVRRVDGMAFEANVRGRAYTAFGCADMMRQLCDAALKWDRPDYLDLAELCGRTILTRWSRGGLLSDEGSWLHARTDVVERTPGGTLNKALIAISAMASAAAKFEMAGRDSFAGALRSRGEACMAQLADRRAWPNISDFVATKVNKRGRKKVVARAWLAYAIDWDRKSIYYIKVDRAKNGMYAITSIAQIAAISSILNVDEKALADLEIGNSGRNIFGLFEKTCRIKEREGWYKPSRTAGDGNFDALSLEHNPGPVIAPWLQSFIDRWA